MQTLLPSVLRTLVPIVYALLIRAGFKSLGLDDLFLQGLAATIVTVLFYIVLRIAERYQSQVGWLLGYGSSPDSYSPGESQG